MNVSLTSTQTQVDDLVSTFLLQATDWKNLAAMTAAGTAYRLGRIGAMTAGVGKLASVGIGLGTEVAAFEMTSRSLQTVGGHSPFPSNLWRWEGQGGIRQGLLSSLITFGALKGAGRLAQGENVIVQHLLQDAGMVLGHQVSGAFGIAEKLQGSLAEQLLHAEVKNIQMAAGMALAHGVAPGLQGLERGLDLSFRGIDAAPSRQMELPSALAFESIAPAPSKKKPNSANVWMMSSSERPKNLTASGSFLSWRTISSMIPPALMDLETLIRVAAEHPKHVFSLKKLADLGNTEAQAALRTLRVETLAQQAQKDPEAIMALRCLTLFLNMRARESLQDLDIDRIALKAASDERALEALIVAAGFGLHGNPRAVQALGRLAENKPQAAGALYTLVVTENEEAGELLRNLPVSRLAHLAEKDPYAFTVLAFMVRTGNPHALPTLAKIAQNQNVEVGPLQILASDEIEGALDALAKAAETNEKAVRSLQFLASTEVTGALKMLALVSTVNLIAARALAKLAEVQTEGALEALVGVTEANPEAVPLLYSLAHSSNILVAHRAQRILISGTADPVISPLGGLAKALQRLKEAHNLRSIVDAVGDLRFLAVEDPEGVFALNHLCWNSERKTLAAIARAMMKKLAVDRLALHAQRIPSAVMALSYLALAGNREADMEMEFLPVEGLLATKNKKEGILALRLLYESGNERAWNAFLNFDPATIAPEGPLDRTTLFALSLLANENHEAALEILRREAEADPYAVFVLEYLAQNGLINIDEILLHLDVSRLTEAAQTHSGAMAALFHLAQKGNPQARTALENEGRLK
jgi:hypothetical protein